MKHWRWFLAFGLISVCGMGYYFLTSPDHIFDLRYHSLPTVQEVLDQKQAKPEPLSQIWAIDTSLCFSVKQEITSTNAETVRFYIDGYTPLYRWVEAPPSKPFVFCSFSLQDRNIGHHVARVEFQSPSGQQYSYTWVFEVKEDGIVPEVTATAVP